MTLAEWSKVTGILPTHPTTERGAVSVVLNTYDNMRFQLWQLSDYGVSSTGGDVVWLMPRIAPK